jgi:ribonuclease P protein component
MSSQRFGKARRVRRSGEYQRAFKAGIRVHGRYFTFVMSPNGSSIVRLGLVASRKLGDAVTRNRAKRLIREVFRRMASPAPAGVDVVVIPRAALLDAPFESVRDDFRGAFERGISRIAPNAGR